MRKVIEAKFVRQGTTDTYRLVKLVGRVTMPPMKGDLNRTPVRTQECVPESYVKQFIDDKDYKIVVS